MERLLGDLTSRNTDQGRRPGAGGPSDVAARQGGWLNLVVGKDGCGGYVPEDLRQSDA